MGADEPLSQQIGGFLRRLGPASRTASGGLIPLESGGPLPTRLFSAEELTRLRGFPAEVSRDELIRYFTLTEPDVALVHADRQGLLLIS